MVPVLIQGRWHKGKEQVGRHKLMLAGLQRSQKHVVTIEVFMFNGALILGGGGKGDRNLKPASLFVAGRLCQPLYHAMPHFRSSRASLDLCPPPIPTTRDSLMLLAGPVAGGDDQRSPGWSRRYIALAEICAAGENSTLL